MVVVVVVVVVGGNGGVVLVGRVEELELAQGRGGVMGKTTCKLSGSLYLPDLGYLRYQGDYQEVPADLLLEGPQVTFMLESWTGITGQRR